MFDMNQGFQAINVFRKHQSPNSDYETQVKLIINNDLGIKSKIMALKGLKLQVQKTIQDKLRLKILVEQQQSKILVIHQKSKSNSTNYSFDNMVSVSQVASTNEQKQRQMFDTMKENYLKQIKKKEQELIQLKKERYVFTETLEDIQYDLEQTKRYNQFLHRELSNKEDEGRKLLQLIEKSKNSTLKRFFQQNIDNLQDSSRKIVDLWHRKGNKQQDSSVSSYRTQQCDDQQF